MYIFKPPSIGGYEDVSRFYKSPTSEEIKEHGYVVTSGRYVGVEAAEHDGLPFEEKMERLTATFKSQLVESDKLAATIKSNLKEL